MATYGVSFVPAHRSECNPYCYYQYVVEMILYEIEDSKSNCLVHFHDTLIQNIFTNIQRFLVFGSITH